MAFGADARVVLDRDGTAAEPNHLAYRTSHGVGIASVFAVLVLLGLLPIMVAATGSQVLSLFDAFYRSGSPPPARP
jgi:chromate transporter